MKKFILIAFFLGFLSGIFFPVELIKSSFEIQEIETEVEVEEGKKEEPKEEKLEKREEVRGQQEEKEEAKINIPYVEREISFIVLHHSGTNNGNVETFRDYHINQKGWRDIGYHFVITNGESNGQIQVGRPLEVQGAHAGNRNKGSVGICLVGNNDFTDKQIESLILLIKELCHVYDIEPSKKTIKGHHERCPGEDFPWDVIWESLKTISSSNIDELFLWG